jgi:hypothetical protein
MRGARMLCNWTGSLQTISRTEPFPHATWGLHLADVNIALGNLVDLVGTEAKAYLKRSR